MEGTAQAVIGGRDWPFGDLAPLRYRVILADPPWRFRTFSAKGEGRSPSRHYACMDIAELAALPVGQLAAPDAALILWATAPLLPQAVWLMEQWGFAYKSAGAWAKQSTSSARWAFGTGYLLRSAAEFFLLGTIGRPRIRSRAVRNLIVAPVREHSRKPDLQYEMAEALFDGPRCELFARQARPGWDAWGHEVGMFAAEAAA